MYIRKSSRVYKGKTYTNHLLVESVQTPKGPRQRAICSLGSLAPAPQEEWLALAHKLQSSLQGQHSFETPPIDTLIQSRAQSGDKAVHALKCGHRGRRRPNRHGGIT